MSGAPEIALWILLVVASATDILWGKIFNWLTFPFFFTGLAFRFAVGGWKDGTDALLAVAVAFGLFFPLYAVKAVAAGDAKLLMAMGAWMDAPTVLQVAGIAILVGAVVGLVALLRQRGLRAAARSLAENVKSAQPTATSMKMAFGPAFFCAFLIVRVAQERHWQLL